MYNVLIVEVTKKIEEFYKRNGIKYDLAVVERLKSERNYVDYHVLKVLEEAIRFSKEYLDIFKNVFAKYSRVSKELYSDFKDLIQYLYDDGGFEKTNHVEFRENEIVLKDRLVDEYDSVDDVINDVLAEDMNYTFDVDVPKDVIIKIDDMQLYCFHHSLKNLGSLFTVDELDFLEFHIGDGCNEIFTIIIEKDKKEKFIEFKEKWSNV